MLNLPRLYDASRESSEISFIELEPPSVRVPQAPRFFFGTFTGQLSESYFKLTHLHQIGVFVCHNTEIRAPYLITHDGAVMACPQANLHEAHLEQFLSDGAAATGQRSLRIGGACAMVFGPGYRIFGHWMIDFLPKLYLLERAGYDLARTSFLLPSDCPSFGFELLGLVGVKRDRIVQFDVQTESVFCERLLVPTTCHNGLLPAHLFSENIGWVRSKIEANIGPLKSDERAERLFVSRGHRAARNRALVNREAIEAMAVAHGFKLIYPEEISLFKQFGIFSRAKEIIGEYGSALHSAMFSPAETIVCALRGDSVHPGFVQSAIGEALGHHMGYVIGKNIHDKWDFVVKPENFDTTLRVVFGGASLRVTSIAKTDRSLPVGEPPSLPKTELVSPVPPMVNNATGATGTSAIDLRELMIQFESLGESCEFGLVQRHCEAEPLGLFRFASAPLPKLLAALSADFAGFGEPDAIGVQLSGREYMINDTRFGLLYHAWVLAGEMTPEEIHQREIRRLPLLIRKLREDLAGAEKIFVYHGMGRLCEADALPLVAALRRYGPNTLLWVELADADHPAGTVARAGTGLLRGYIDRFAPSENAHNFSLDRWIAICREAYHLWVPELALREGARRNNVEH